MPPGLVKQRCCTLGLPWRGGPVRIRWRFNNVCIAAVCQPGPSASTSVFAVTGAGLPAGKLGGVCHRMKVTIPRFSTAAALTVPPPSPWTPQSESPPDSIAGSAARKQPSAGVRSWVACASCQCLAHPTMPVLPAPRSGGGSGRPAMIGGGVQPGAIVNAGCNAAIPGETGKAAHATTAGVRGLPGPRCVLQASLVGAGLQCHDSGTSPTGLGLGVIGHIVDGRTVKCRTTSDLL